jgi:hypothetical protein
VTREHVAELVGSDLAAPAARRDPPDAHFRRLVIVLEKDQAVFAKDRLAE